MDRDPILRDYLRVVRRRRWLELGGLLLGIVVALAYTFLRKPTYAATAQVVVPQFGRVNFGDPTSMESFDPTTLENYVTGEATFAKGDSVRAAVTKSLGFRPRKASVKVIENTQVLTITARDGDRHRVAKIANAYAAEYLSAHRKSSVALNQSIAKQLQARVNVLRSQELQYPPSDSWRMALAGQISQMQAGISNLNMSNAVNVHPGEVIAEAKTPSSPASPRLGFDLVVGVVVGLVVGFGGAFVWDPIDDRIKSKRDLETTADGLATIGVVPRVKEWREEGQSRVMSLEDPYSPAAEAYGTIRTSLQIHGSHDPFGVVAFTSAKAGEGKSSTVANLGVAFARSGRRTVVVCGDLRRPRLHEYFGKEDLKGFTNVLMGEIPLASALHPVEGVPGLSLLAAGPPVPNPAELLSSPGSRKVFEQLRRDFDVVLVDCTPVLPVPDSLELSTLVDGMVLVVGARRSNRREIIRTLEVLGQVEAPVIGTVLNQVARADVEEGYSSYAFGYAPYAPTDKGAHVSGNGSATPPPVPGNEVAVGNGNSQMPPPVPAISEPGVVDD